MSAVCCQVEVSATSLSLVQRSPNECFVYECDHEASKWGGPVPLGPVAQQKKKQINKSVYDCTVEDVEYIYNKLSI